MPTVLNYSPRRYYVDKAGRRVLVGLTLEETSEFETLDNLCWPGNSSDYAAGKEPRSPDQRWAILYSKHDEAWKVWAATGYATPP